MNRAYLPTNFGKLFKSLRLQAGFFTLQALSAALIPYGLTVDPSLLSHWQRGSRLPKDRQVILMLLKLLEKQGGLTTPQDANQFSEAAGMGFLTEKEMFELFPKVEILPDRKQFATKLKVYFTATIIQQEELGTSYSTIMNTVEKLGHTVIHEHLALHTMEEIGQQPDSERVNNYRNVLQGITYSDVVIVEGSYPSTISVGYKLSLALIKHKPTILFFKEGRVPHFFRGLQSEKLILIEYTEKNLMELVQQSVAFVHSQFVNVE